MTIDEEFDAAVRAGGTQALSLIQRDHALRIVSVLISVVPILDRAMEVDHDFNRLAGPRRASRLVELMLLDLVQSLHRPTA